MAWSDTTIWLATTTGSTPRCGEAPCVPTPRTWMFTESALDDTICSGTSIRPASISDATWKASATSGFGKRV